MFDVSEMITLKVTMKFKPRSINDTLVLFRDISKISQRPVTLTLQAVEEKICISLYEA